ncbi:hypothetical protein [Chromobacterium sp. IIBBL 290-4]|uniref:hypothetical protein n=1 Tax=Chromobacterium sp. IIBBL 290-4 TaxID=2953890 RepID=UPI0020B68389|nr:hypothetical protein [Chromobacterium sp. IIBBL 290-4]UTH75687.1 hypothetical protein NKT35_06200 [Chromobacterium sp. IIBBL 290-4]
MFKSGKSIIINPSMINQEKQAELIDSLYPIHAEIFDGVSKNDFANYVIQSTAPYTRILLHKDKQGNIVGYCAMHFFEQTIENKPATIIRMEAGLKREYRQGNRNSPFVIGQLLAYRLRRPLTKLYYLGALVHPSSFMLLSKYAPQVWPSARYPDDSRYRRIAAQLIRAFKLQAVDDAEPGVVHVGWRTRDTQAEQTKWAQIRHEAAQFYMRRNPGYVEGHGLLTLVPVNAACVLFAIKSLLADRWARLRQPRPANRQAQAH